MAIEWIDQLVSQFTTEEGFDREGFNEAVSKEFAKNAVPKKEFNEKIDELKTVRESLDTATATIEDLQKSNEDNQALQDTITQLQADLTSQQTSFTNQKKTYAIREELRKNGVLDPDYIIFKQGGLEGFSFDDDGNPSGVTDVVSRYKEDSAYKHLFRVEKPAGYEPTGGKPPEGDNPFDPKTRNLTKQGELLRTDPERARRLAKAAGIDLG